ncbi:hypothetical protein MKEN_00579300 [Mycena kentingensis (nom. inval.)]|nr:hypothetical protein MKEN_00579300 [Mycena kentingensis (nom. inval.)]
MHPQPRPSSHGRVNAHPRRRRLTRHGTYEHIQPAAVDGHPVSHPEVQRGVYQRIAPDVPAQAPTLQCRKKPI